MTKPSLTELLNIKHPIIMAPMFLVSNTAMTIEGMKAGVAGCIPALNYRTLEELRTAIKELKANKPRHSHRMMVVDEGGMPDCHRSYSAYTNIKSYRPSSF